MFTVRPKTITVKVSSECNMSCVYCYEKKWLNHEQRKLMPLSLVEKVMKDISSFAEGNFQFIWHGGEPLLAGIDYYREILRIQARHIQSGVAISNCIQTNGLLLDEKWIEFAEEHDFGIGISFDGPRLFHEIQRPLPKPGNSYQSCMRAIKLLQKHDFPFMVACVITKQGCHYPDLYWDFFKAHQIKDLDLLPCLFHPHNPNGVDYIISESEFFLFMKRIFTNWINENDGTISIKLLENIMLNTLDNTGSTLCQLSGSCLDFYTLAINGDVYACDFFVGNNEFYYGNIKDFHLGELFSAQNLKVDNMLSSLNHDCNACKWLSVCKGGCPYHHYLANIYKSFYGRSPCDGKKCLYVYVQKFVGGRGC